MKSATAGWLPVEGPPVAILTWFGQSRKVVAMLASWLAVIDGRPPELRAGCPGLVTAPNGVPPGHGFGVNVPAGTCLARLIRDLRRFADGPAFLESAYEVVPARMVDTPLLAGCGLQIECARARIATGEWEAELAGDLLLVHRDGVSLDPFDTADLRTLAPLRPCASS